jgi:hypothetical protein
VLEDAAIPVVNVFNFARAGDVVGHEVGPEIHRGSLARQRTRAPKGGVGIHCPANNASWRGGKTSRADYLKIPPTG